jgi:hypothetical protein
LKTDHAHYTKKSWKIPKGAIRRTDNTMVKRTKHTYKNQMTSHYKRYAKPCISLTGTNRTNEGLHITEVCKAVYEPHRDKQNKEMTLH